MSDNNSPSDVVLIDSKQGNESNSDSDAETNNVENKTMVEHIYKVMSDLVEKIHTDNNLLNVQFAEQQEQINTMTSKLTTIDSDHRDFLTTYTSEITSITDQLQKLNYSTGEQHIVEVVQQNLKTLQTEVSHIKTHQNDVAELQRQILDTRTMLLQTMTKNMQNIKRDLMDVRKIKNDIRPVVKTIIVEEMKSYMENMPSIEKKFDDLAKRQQVYLSNYIRKSTVQRASSLHSESNQLIATIQQQISLADKTHDIDQLRRQYIEFMTNTETRMKSMNEKINKLITGRIIDSPTTSNRSVTSLRSIDTSNSLPKAETKTINNNPLPISKTNSRPDNLEE